MAEHLCHAHGCKRSVPPRMFACREHWWSLRPALRAAIWREYRDRQEVTKTPTVRYVAVQRLAVAELAFKPHDEEAARISASYLMEAIRFREMAISMGAGDPLLGLVPETTP